jgi:hypothetical protein
MSFMNLNLSEKSKHYEIMWKIANNSIEPFKNNLSPSCEKEKIIKIAEEWLKTKNDNSISDYVYYSLTKDANDKIEEEIKKYQDQVIPEANRSEKVFHTPRYFAYQTMNQFKEGLQKRIDSILKDFSTNQGETQDPGCFLM